MSRWTQDLRHVGRRLWRAPAFSFTVVVTVAVGVATFASIFAVVDSVLLEAMPYRDPQRLVYLWRDYPWIDFPRGWMGGVDVLALRESSTALEEIAVLRSGSFNLSSRDGGEPEEIRVMLVSDNFFDLLGIDPDIGRGFQEGEDDVGAPPVVVLGHALWQQRYGGEPQIVGRDIYLDDEVSRVVGVAPPGFDFAMHSSLGSPVTADAYATLQWDLAGLEGGSLAALARVRPGVGPEALQADLDSVVSVLDQEVFGGRGLRVWAAPLRHDLVKDVAPALRAVLGAALLLLLILAVNLTTLLVGRAARRRRETAVRAALGAGRGTLFREGMAESVLPCAAGGVLGVLAAVPGVRLLLALAPRELPRQAAIGVDAGTVAVGLAAAAGIGVLAGVGPALRTALGGLAATLQEAGVRGDGGGDGRARSALVVAQVALSLVLLAGAGVLGRSFVDMLRADPGFDPRGVLTLRVPLSEGRYTEGAQAVAFYDRLRRRLATLPGVEAAGGATSLPLTEETSQSSARFPGAPGNAGDEDADAPLVDYFSATPGYLEAMGVPLRAGRGFAEADDAEAPLVAVIDASLADRFFPDGAAVGQEMVFDGESRRIVGVVDQPRLYDVHRDDRGQVFLPLGQVPSDGLSFAVRGDRDPESLATEIRAAVREIDPDQPVAEVRTMDAIVGASLTEERLSLLLIGSFSLAALLLAILGLYGVVSNTVTRRTHEMGLRMALGADARRVRGLVVGQGLRLTAAGVGLGLVGAVAATRLLEGLLVGVDPADPATLAAVALILTAIAAVASWLPARRATRIDPAVALRSG